jgi:hypothetical protein
MATTPTKPGAIQTPKTQTKNARKLGKEKPTNPLTSRPPHSRLLS